MNIDLTIASQILLTGLASAVFTGILAFAVQKLFIERWLNRSLEKFKVDLQLGAFERQAWWQRKADAYSQIIDALVELQYFFGRWIDTYELGKDLDSETREDLNKVHLQAKKHLTKAVFSGEYIVSDDTASALEELLRELEKSYPENLFRELEESYVAVKECIARIRECAKADLHKHW